MDDIFNHHQFYLVDEEGDCDLLERLYTPLEVVEALLHGLNVAVIELGNFEWVYTLHTKLELRENWERI